MVCDLWILESPSTCVYACVENREEGECIHCLASLGKAKPLDPQAEENFAR